jgi:hypothetical protein
MRMSEYQMANAGAKAIAASQSVEARKVGCGSNPDSPVARSVGPVFLYVQKKWCSAA